MCSFIPIHAGKREAQGIDKVPATFDPTGLPAYCDHWAPGTDGLSGCMDQDPLSSRKAAQRRVKGSRERLACRCSPCFSLAGDGSPSNPTGHKLDPAELSCCALPDAGYGVMVNNEDTMHSRGFRKDS